MANVWDEDDGLREEAEAESKKFLHSLRTGNGNGHDDDDQIVSEQLEPLAITAIPPRPWSYGHFLLAGCASVIGAVDGGGKGAMAVAIALSMITGKELLGERVWRTGPVVIVSYEDDKMEWRRRIASACLHYGVDYDSVCSNFHFLWRPRSQIAFAARLANARGDSKIGFPDSEAIIAHLNRIKPALFIVDPFNRAHALEDGNSNVMIALVAGEISRIAAATGCAALVLHHLRKGATGEADDLMGATALRSTFRAARILVRMTRDEAEGFNLPPTEAWRYSRIASTKENYTRPEHARWYRLDSVELGNTAVDPTYPDGDNVQVSTPWTPPDAFEGLSKTAIADIFAAFRDGPGDGEFYSAHPQSTFNAATVIVERSGKNTDEAWRILNKWKETGVIGTADYWSNAKRKRRARIIVDEAKARDILGALYRTPEGPP